jgi:hypothetical protein
LWFLICSNPLGRIAQRQWLVASLIGFLGFIGSALVGLVVGIPEPKFHDEFSYLLAADTFAHGRLTNPTHPMWTHFESFHIIQQPTYMSKYPPGQGLVMAIGQVTAGHPIVGVWMSFGFMCAAISWMLYAWVSPRWALLGGALALINPVLGVAGYWAQSYWGGAVAATGGALVLGGIKRLMRQPHVHVSLLTAIGLAILANSRLFEGLLVSLPASIFLFTRIVGYSLKVSIRRIIVPILIVLSVTIIGMGFYNLRITGNPLRMPYQVHEETYAMAPVFVWQKLPSEPEYRHKLIRDFHATYALSFYTSQRSISGFLTKNLYSLLALEIGITNVLLIPVVIAFPILVPWTLRNRWASRGFLIYLVLILGLLTETFKWSHYLAPIIGLNYYFVLAALRLVRYRYRGVGHLVLWPTALLAIIALLALLYGTVNRDKSSSWQGQRAKLLDQLNQEDGKHLIVVSYGAAHSVHNEWVYNAADIDRSKVVFARAINSTQDCQLVKYFKSRRLWSLDVNGSIAKLEPYPRNQCQGIQPTNH